MPDTNTASCVRFGRNANSNGFKLAVINYDEVSGKLAQSLIVKVLCVSLKFKRKPLKIT